MLKPITICAIAAITLSACGTSQSATDLPPGQYHHMTRSTTPEGTTVVNSDTTTVTSDNYGNKTAVVNSKTTKDPRGLFNKSTQESTTVVRED